MKANQKFKNLSKNDDAYIKIVGSLVALLLAIIVGVLVYFEMLDSVSSFSEDTVEVFTGYTTASNASAWSVTLQNSPASATVTNVTCANMTAGSESYPTFSLNHRTISVGAGGADQFTQVNVTYTSNIATDESTATDMASTVFGLLPIIALVVVASIILGIVLGFGGSKGGEI